MHKWGLALATALLAGCATAPLADRAEVYPTQPSEMLPIEDQQVLFWDDATRSDRFRRMEDIFAGIEAEGDREYRALPRGEPFDAATLAKIDGYLVEMNAAGIMVLQDGEVRLEKYRLGFGPEQRWTSFSVAKSFTSTLLGAAIKDGAIGSIDDPVTRYLPALAGTAYEGVTVRQLVTMTSGVRWNEDYADPNSDVAKMLLVAPVAGESAVACRSACRTMRAWDSGCSRADSPRCRRDGSRMRAVRRSTSVGASATATSGGPIPATFTARRGSSVSTSRSCPSRTWSWRSCRTILPRRAKG